MRTVNILGTEYRIIKEDFNGEECDGYCDYTSKEIHIRNDNVNDVGDFDYLMKKQLRHEIVHAFLGESGLDNYSSDEVLVQWMAAQLPKMFQAMKECECI